jgi:host factor-I protein
MQPSYESRSVEGNIMESRHSTHAEAKAPRAHGVRERSLQDDFLSDLHSMQAPVLVYLSNGIRLQGTIGSFDTYVVWLRNDAWQMIYKHAIFAIVPAETGAQPMRSAPKTQGAAQSDEARSHSPERPSHPDKSPRISYRMSRSRDL